MNKEIEITKENYKEYTELYKILSTYDGKKEMKKGVKDTLILFTVYIGLYTGIIKVIPMIVENVFGLGIAILSSMGVGFYTAFLSAKRDKKKDLEAKKKRYREQNPNSEIDIDVDEYSLYNSLKKAGIIYHEYREGIRIEKISTKNFEEKLKQEELLEIGNKIKQEMIEENKHNYSHLDFETEISEQELVKVKQKIKKMTR